MAEVVTGRSDWITFELLPSTYEQREGWLRKQIANRPADKGSLVGDYLPSLLVSAPDTRVLVAVFDLLYSPERIVESCALASLWAFREQDLRAQTLDSLKRQGPNDPMAYLISWHAPWFEESKEDIAETSLRYLRSSSDSQIAATLKLLGFLVHGQNFHWSPDSGTPAKCDQSVLDIGAALSGRSADVAQALAVYLGSIRNSAARGLLWQLSKSGGPEREQALIALTWIAEPSDLDPLAELLVMAGDADKYGRTRASLAYALMRAYGDRAIPYLEKAEIESPYVFVRMQSAEQLVLKGRPAGVRFFIDAIENDRFGKSELSSWLRSQFPEELSSASNDAALLAFLRARLNP